MRETTSREGTALYVHSVPGASRIHPSASRWSSIQFLYVSTTVVTVLLAGAVLLSVLLRHRDKSHDRYPASLVDALSKTLQFFDAQKSGALPKNNFTVRFRADSGLKDGDPAHGLDLTGGFYDSGNNVKFSFLAAYSVTLLSWAAVEYRGKLEGVGELEHLMDIVKWGADYLLKLFNSSDPTSPIYSQVGSTSIAAGRETDLTCWQRPEDMAYPRPVSACHAPATDLAGEITAALSAASLLFLDTLPAYSKALVWGAESLFARTNASTKHATYTWDDACGGGARGWYESSGYADELTWAATWLYLATGKKQYLRYACEGFSGAVEAEARRERGVFYWNNKVAATAVLLTRVRYLHDPGYPYESTLWTCSAMTANYMCAYLGLLSNPTLSPDFIIERTPGGLMLPAPNTTSALHFSSTVSFLAKAHADHLTAVGLGSTPCAALTNTTSQAAFTTDDLRALAESQLRYALGDNPAKTSYIVGVGEKYPERVHHRAASLPWDGQRYGCREGERWRRDSAGSNPNLLVGAVVNGPDERDGFRDSRERPEYTQPSIAGNAGMVAAILAALEIDVDMGGLLEDNMFVKL